MHGGAERPFQRARLRYDPAFALEAAYCHEQGIPYSEYLRRWNEEDRAIVTAVTIENSKKCSSCGTAEWEWDEDPFAYHPVLHTCRGCQKQELLSEGIEDMPKGTTIRLVDKHTGERMERESHMRQRPTRE